MKVAPLDLSNPDNRRFLEGTGRIFHDPGWLALYDDQIVSLGVYNKNDELRGAMHAYRFKKRGAWFLIDPPLTFTTGLFFQGEEAGKVTRQTREKRLMEAMADSFEPLASAVGISVPPGWTDFMPLINRGYRVQPKYTYLVDLEPSVDDLNAQLSTVRRRNIRNAQRDELTCFSSDQPDLMLNLAGKSLARGGGDFQPGLARKIMRYSMETNRSICYIATYQDDPVAGAFCVINGDTAVYLVGGMDPEKRHQSGSALALWNCMLEAKSQGCRYFNFAGSMVPAIERFFRGFGGTLTPYYSISRAPWHIELPMRLTGKKLI